MKSIYKYIIFSFLGVLSVLPVNAQKEKTETDTISKKWIKSVRAEVDIVPLATYFLISDDVFLYQGSVQADLLHKYFPVVEFGYAGANHTTTEGIGFKTDGLFGRIGLDFNLMKPKKDAKPTNNLFLAGVRLGLSDFRYDLTNVEMTNEYWNETTTLDYINVPATKLWFEVVAGIRVEIIENVFMGWSIRNKFILGKPLIGEMTPWYIPGFGINSNASVFTFNYTIGYKFPVK